MKKQHDRWENWDPEFHRDLSKASRPYPEIKMASDVE
jgi:hypothetical protein